MFAADEGISEGISPATMAEIDDRLPLALVLRLSDLEESGAPGRYGLRVPANE
jgi:hypothetical protein